MSTSMQAAADVLQEYYTAALKQQIKQGMVMDKYLGPYRPVYGPHLPFTPEGACGNWDCQCCNTWRDYDYDRCC